MAYEALYSRARPKTLSRLIGQESIVKALTQAISGDKLSHAYLLVGTRGTGKTSTARLLAKAINCENVRQAQAAGRLLDPKEIPCNKCDSCKNFAASQDNVEFDAASKRSVEDITRVLSNAYLSPAAAHKKTFIIDEVHMLSNEAMNSILKLIEEPPPQVTFFLATTEFNKVPMTIRSRCQVLNFRLIPIKTVAPYLKWLAQLLGVTLHEDAAIKIARLSGGSMRDALTYLDQCYSIGEKEILLTTVDEMLGLISDEKLDAIISALRARDRKATADAITAAFDSGVAPNSIAEALITRLRDLEFARLQRGERSFANIDGLVDALRKAINEMYGSGIPEIILEMTLLKLAAPVQTPVQVVASRQSSAPAEPTSANLDAGKKIFYDVLNNFGRQDDSLNAIVSKAVVTNFDGKTMTLGFKSPALASMFGNNKLAQFEQQLAQAAGHPIKISVVVNKNMSAPILEQLNEPDRTALAGAMNVFGATDATKI